MATSSCRRTEALIDLEAIRHNYALACTIAPSSKNVPVIKANGYGHGLVPVAEALQDVAPVLAVAILDEALELRAAGIEVPLLVLEGASSGDACEVAAANALSLVIHNEEQASVLLSAALGGPVPLWLKVDSGMHRLGLAPGDLRQVFDRLRDAGQEVDVICTHLASADDMTSNTTRDQLEIFRACTSGLGKPLSISNSAGILAWPDSHADWNRPGYMLYGNSPLAEEVDHARNLRAAMTLRAEIIAIREVATGDAVGYNGRWRATQPSAIATVAAGYADGYPRHAPDGTPTFVNGRIAPLAGTVSMDMITVDVTGHDRVSLGDSVELWGSNVSVNEVAMHAGTIGYELLTSVTPRVPRRYSSP